MSGPAASTAPSWANESISISTTIAAARSGGNVLARNARPI